MQNEVFGREIERQKKHPQNASAYFSNFSVNYSGKTQKTQKRKKNSNRQ